jgi:hypothetical protein
LSYQPKIFTRLLAAWIVVMKPLVKPDASFRTLTIGTTQGDLHRGDAGSMEEGSTSTRPAR